MALHFVVAPAGAMLPLAELPLGLLAYGSLLPLEFLFGGLVDLQDQEILLWIVASLLLLP